MKKSCGMSWSLVLTTAITVMGLPGHANGSVETDRNVGECVNYLSIIRKPNAAKIALGQADNPQRAMQFARTALGRIERESAAGRWGSSQQQAFAVAGDRACRNIGVRPADYSN